MPNVPKQSKGQGQAAKKATSSSSRSRKKRSKSNPVGSLAATAPSLSRINFHGSFKTQATKALSAKDLGIPVGASVYVQSVDMTVAASDGIESVYVRIVDYLVSGKEAMGPSSRLTMCPDGAMIRFSIKNPNPRIFTTVGEESDELAVLTKTGTTVTVNFVGTITVVLQSLGSRNVA